MNVRLLPPLLAVLLTAGCDVVPKLSARAGAMYAALDGAVSLAPTPGSPSATARVDVHDDLGIDSSASPFVELGLDTMLGRFEVNGLHYSDASEGTLSGSFGDIAAGLPVRAEVDLDLVRAFWAFDLIDLGPLRLSPGLGVDWLDLDTRVASLTPVSVYEELDVSAAMPLLVLDAAVELGPVTAEATVGAMDLDVGDFGGTFFDADARLGWQLAFGAELFAGYRHVRIDAVGVSGGQDYDADLTLAGWYVGGGFRF